MRPFQVHLPLVTLILVSETSLLALENHVLHEI